MWLQLQTLPLSSARNLNTDVFEMCCNHGPSLGEFMAATESERLDPLFFFEVCSHAMAFAPNACFFSHSAVLIRCSNVMSAKAVHESNADENIHSCSAQI